MRSQRSTIISRASVATSVSSGGGYPGKPRRLRSVALEVAVNRIQRFFRHILFLRSLVHRVIQENGESVSVFRLQLQRQKMVEDRAAEICASIARRCLGRFVRKWIHSFRTRQGRYKELPPNSLLRTQLQSDTIVAAVLAIQSFGFAIFSREEVQRRQLLQQCQSAARTIEAAWLRSQRYAITVRRIQDRAAQNVLIGHEYIERRELLRRQYRFLVVAHQQLFNSPLMFSAGLATRLLPSLMDSILLFTNGGVPLFPTGETGAVAVVTQDSSSQLVAKVPPLVGGRLARRRSGEGSGPFGLPTRTTWGTGPYHPYFQQHATPQQKTIQLLERRLLYSAAERQLLGKDMRLHADSDESVSGSSAGVSDCSNSFSAAHSTDMAEVATYSSNATGKMPPPVLHTSADAFRRALDTFNLVDSQATPQDEEAAANWGLRSATDRLYYELQMRGHISAELVAPLTCYPDLYHEVVCGRADQSALTATPGLAACKPVLVYPIASRSTSRRITSYMMDVVVKTGTERRGGAVSTEARSLPTSFVEYRAFAHQGTEESQRLVSCTKAGLQRHGYTNVAMECFFSINPAPSSTATAEVAPLVNRYVASIGALGSMWWSFFVMDCAPLAELKGGKSSTSSHDSATATVSQVAPFPSPASTASQKSARQLVGIRSVLGGTPKSYLLRNWLPGAKCSTENPPREAGSPACVSVVKPEISTARESPVEPTYFNPRKWLYQMEQLLVQERTRRSRVSANESLQRSSVYSLQKIALSLV